MTGVNLVSGAPPSTKVAGIVPSAAACQALCDKDHTCNFWTWHDEQITPPSWRGKCYVRNDATYAYKKETHHVSGVCNHTLVPGGGGSSMGVRGKSVGFKMIDWVPQTTASKVRFRCTGSMAAGGGAKIRSFSLHSGQRPASRDEGL